ncbi:MAG: hypothetical protein WDM76_13435 [Limisphaerales bacterium]
MFARGGIESGAWFVPKSTRVVSPINARTNQNPLAFALRQHTPRTLGQIFALDLPQ